MHTLDAADILVLWETARGYHPVDQALAMLAASEPQRSRDELAALPLGQRDERLIALRIALFGDRLPCRAQCPQCNESAEFDVSCSALQAPSGPPASDHLLQLDGFELLLKPIDSSDLAAAASTQAVDEARQVLLARCIRVAPQRGGSDIALHELPARIIAAASQRLEELDPRSEIFVNLCCPTCAYRWQNVLDIAHILWNEVAACAQRLFMEVDMLARAYGWCEADILALNPVRRASYIQLVAG